MNAGSNETVDNWLSNQYQLNGSTAASFSEPIDDSLVSDPAPETVYQSYAQSNFGIGNRLAYQLPVADGSYDVRLHFAEPSATSAGSRVFDVLVNGGLAEDDFDIVAVAGSRYTATTLSLSGVMASGGEGLLLELVNETSNAAILSAIEITTVNGGGVTSPTVDLQLSTNDGGTYATIASGLSMDRYGRGSFLWTATPETSGNMARLQVVSNNGSLPTDASNDPFLVANDGNSYYVNDRSQVDDTYSTALGDNANSGKTAAAPMASLRALLSAYDLNAGDTIFVDTGTYDLLGNIVIDAADAGVTIQGPAAAGNAAVLDRANTTSGSYVVELIDADGVTLDGLSLTGGEYGVYAANDSDSDDVTITNSRVFDNDRNGILIFSGNDRLTLSGNTVFDHRSSSSTGIFVTGSSAVMLQGNTVYSNGTGIYVDVSFGSLDEATISNNRVFDNLNAGIVADGPVLVSGNTVFGHDGSSSTAILLDDGARATQNTVYANTNGIRVGGRFGGALATGNRVYDNSNIGILAQEDSLVRGNTVYSNSVGIQADVVTTSTSNFYGRIENNLVYANSNQGIVIDDSAAFSGQRAEVINNTVYQEVGDAIRVQGTAEEVELKNNILWIEEGYALFVTADSQIGFESDYNLFFVGDVPNAFVGFWGGITADLLSDWQATSGQDTTSVAGDPRFVDPDGADNILGFDSSIDAGTDDNFALALGSPAIDRADSWAAGPVDLVGFTRRDDPGVANAGSDDYFENDLGLVSFVPGGVAQGLQADNSFFTIDFSTDLGNPAFAFDFYGINYTSVVVSSNGFLQFGSSTDAADGANSFDTFLEHPRIAPLWDDLSTEDGDVYLADNSGAGDITIRWDATNRSDGSPVHVAVTIASSGLITFDYGAGNVNLTPTIGISRGDGRNYVLSTLDGSTDLTDANSHAFVLTPGITDLGALEFQGSTLDTAPPLIVSTDPSPIDNQGVSQVTFSSFELTLSEPINAMDANAVGNYELREAGPSGRFDDGDDLIFSLLPNYTAGSQQLTLTVVGGDLPEGTYRLTVLSDFPTDTGIHDLAGLLLDGDGDTNPGGNYVRTFVINLTEPCDFNGDGDCDVADLDPLIAEIAGGGNSPSFDLNDDGLVNLTDRDLWLAFAGEVNLGSGASYLLGDATLDGVVDVSDFNVWNSNKFTTTAAWSAGDFNADGVTDVTDFNVWNANKFNSSTAMPQPLSGTSVDPEAEMRMVLAAPLPQKTYQRTQDLALLEFENRWKTAHAFGNGSVRHAPRRPITSEDIERQSVDLLFAMLEERP